MASLGTNDNNSIIKDPMVTSTDSLTQKQQDSARKLRNHEERLRLVKDRQNEERQRKLEELKAQALAAQKYREQKEEERKRRIEEMKLKENDKRQQVEDRKKAIMDAERERREYIMRKNQEREARLDTKKRNERSSISFAFGSSTPRLLDPVEVSLVAPTGSYWGHRRSTSISNVSYNGNATQLSRRSSERELSDGAKKRATSAGGLDRPDDLHKMSTSMYEVFNWGHVNESRPKRLSLFAGASEINIDDPPSTIMAQQKTTHSRPHGSRSGEVTPGGSSRPGSAMSTSTTASGVVNRRTTTVRKPRPASIAGTGMSQSIDSPDVFKSQKKDKPPSRPTSAIRRSSSNTAGNLVNGSPASNSTKSTNATNDSIKRNEKRAPIKKATTPRSVESPKLASPQTELISLTVSEASIASATEKATVQTTEEIVLATDSNTGESISIETTTIVKNIETEQPQQPQQPQQQQHNESVETKEMKSEPEIQMSNGDAQSLESNKTVESETNDMTASMIQRRIRSEDEAKAALAERRRLAREEAERQAQLEKQRQEQERQEQLRLEAEEAERQRQFEQEALRLVEEQRRAEELRLQKAIEEAQKREQEERMKREEEERARQEREEQEKRAREEAERQKIEVAERLKKEEKEREERRKRVEAIMARTRAKNAAANAANSTPNKPEENSSQQTTNESTNNATANNISTASDKSNDSNRKLNSNEYEKSVTDKENALIHTFSNLIDSKQSPQHTVVHHADNNGLHNNTKTNGKLLDFTHSLNDDHSNDIAKTPISNGNGHPLISNLDNKIDSDLISNQLLDLSLDSSQTAEHTVNFNNNSLITSAPLVTSDSHEAKEISLL